MQSLRHMNSEEVIDQEIRRAAKAAEDAKAAREGSKKPLFLWLKPGQKALIRPLAKMSGAITLMKHNKYHKEREFNVNAICACELEPAKPCLYCELAKDDKKLTPNGWIFLSVFVYQVTNEDGSIATYEEKQEDGSKLTKEVKQTVRLLELTAFGRVAPLLKYFRDFPKDPDNCQLTECDFSIEQIGEGTAKTFMPSHKSSKPMHPSIKAVAASVTEDEMFKRIIAFCPPKVSEDSSDPFEDTPRKGKKDTDPAIEAVVQGVKNGKIAEEVLDDTIMDW